MTVHYLIGEQQTGKTTYMLNQFVLSPKAVFVSFQHNRLKEIADDPIVSQCDVVVIRRMEDICTTYSANNEMKDAIETGFSRPKVHSRYCKDINCPYHNQLNKLKSIEESDHVICTIDTLLTHSEITSGRDIFVDENEALFDEPEFPDTDIPQDDLDYIFDDRKPQSITADYRGCYLTNPVNHYVLKYSFTKRKEKKYVKELDALLQSYPLTKNTQRVKEINTILHYLSGYIVTEHNGSRDSSGSNHDSR
ncbi:MAG: hypothetical protein JRN15_23770, partial [Nitrososphaerota archaeon]|nr:hypothetical protein [Nitrososphaerota archaeon]